MSPKAGDLGDPSPISRRLLAPVPRRLLVLALQKLPRRLLVLAPQKLLVSIWIPPVPRRLLSSAPRKRPALMPPWRRLPSVSRRLLSSAPRKRPALMPPWRQLPPVPQGRLSDHCPRPPNWRRLQCRCPVRGGGATDRSINAVDTHFHRDRLAKAVRRKEEQGKSMSLASELAYVFRPTAA